MSAAIALNLECLHTFNVETPQLNIPTRNAISPDGRTSTFVLPADRDHAIRDYANLNFINAVAISPDNTKIVAVGEKSSYSYRNTNHQYTFTLWDLENGTATDIANQTGYQPHNHHLSSVAFSADGQSLLIGSLDKTSSRDNHPAVSVWSVSQLPKYHKHTPKGGQILSVANHPTENEFATCSTEGIQIWQGLAQPGDFREIQNWKSQPAHTLKFSPNGRWLCNGGTNGEIQLWDELSGDLIQTFEKQPHMIRSLAFSPDSEILVSDSDQKIVIWDIRTQEIRHSFFAHPDWIRGVVITANQKYLLSVGDVKIKIWDLETAELMQAITAHPHIIRSMDISKDGTHLVTGDKGGTVKVWKLES